MIGGPTSGSGNTISGIEGVGVYIVSQNATSSGNIVQSNLIGLAANGARGPGNNGYGVFLLNSPNNAVPLTGSAANRFGRNRIANFRNPSAPKAKTKVKAAKHHADHAASTDGSHHRASHPAGPARLLKRKTR
jgi:hypothetical protein